MENYSKSIALKRKERRLEKANRFEKVKDKINGKSGITVGRLEKEKKKKNLNSLSDKSILDMILVDQ